MAVKGLYRDGKTGEWLYDFRVRGHRFRGSARTGDRREAERIVKEKRREAASVAAQSEGAEAMTFAVASTRWYIEKGQHRARPTEVQRYLAWLQGAIGNRTLIRDISDNIVARIVTARRAEGASHATINRTALEPLRAILRRATVVWRQPVAGVQWGEHLLSEPKERVREASADEEARLLEAMREDYRNILRFALLSGLRAAEIVGMEWEHIDFGGRRLHLVGKGGVVANIPLTTSMERLLRAEQTFGASGSVWRYRPARRERGTVADLTPRPITYEGFKTQFRRARARAGLPSSRADAVLGFRLHDTRHTALTRLIRATGNIKLVQKLARHADIRTTLRYAHASDDDLRAGMETAQQAPPEIFVTVKKADAK